MIYWGAFAAWVIAGILVNLVLGREIAGILHFDGLQPITKVTEDDIKKGDWRLAVAIGLAGPIFLAWWIVHLRDHRIR